MKKYLIFIFSLFLISCSLKDRCERDQSAYFTICSKNETDTVVCQYNDNDYTKTYIFNKKLTFYLYDGDSLRVIHKDSLVFIGKIRHCDDIVIQLSN